MSKLANEWRLRHGIHRFQWLSMLPDLNPVQKMWKQLKMNLARKKSLNLQIISFRNQERVERFSKRWSNKSVTKYEKLYC